MGAKTHRVMRQSHITNQHEAFRIEYNTSPVQATLKSGFTLRFQQDGTASLVVNSRRSQIISVSMQAPSSTARNRYNETVKSSFISYILDSTTTLRGRHPCPGSHHRLDQYTSTGILSSRTSSPKSTRDGSWGIGRARQQFDSA